MKAGARSSYVEFAAGSPIRRYDGGVGGNRILGLFPMPASQELRRKMNVATVTAEGASTGMVDARCSGSENLPHRTKPLSAGGDMHVFPSRSAASARTEGLIPLATMRERYARVTLVKSGIVYVAVWLWI